MTSIETARNIFIEFFKKNNHIHVPSSSLVPNNDPSLLFVNSGMVQFKNMFTGLETRNFTKAVSCQKSLRAGGKHNDLENVGFTARHHTFFEMLGNFSFGDYFKEQAILYAWELLTKHYDIDPKKLLVTVYHTDEEAAEYWKKITGFDDSKIIRIATNDNFWSMGDLGPCGPCSEIFYDHGESVWGGPPGSANEHGDRFIEIWNMVFMQYEQINKDTRIALPKQSVDTGMGLERMTAILQNVHDNYEIDIFKNIINACENIIKVKPQGENSQYYKVIADHLRSIIFLLADGVMPSNEGRGYVLRRIIRRAVRYVHLLGFKDLLLRTVAPYVISLLQGTYPELKRAETLILSVLEQEEKRFSETIDRGIKYLNQEIQDLNSNILSGDAAFKLYDTYGFPLDLTVDILKSNNIAVDHQGFDNKMLEQKERAQKHWLGSGDNNTSPLWFDLYKEHGATEFLGYEQTKIEAEVLELIVSGTKELEIHGSGTKVTILTNQTCFYGESGGQMGDIGFITTPTAIVKIIDTKKHLGKLIAHVGIIENGSISKGQCAKLEIDSDYRQNLRIHHTATHMTHKALQEVLGAHVTQKGSLVAHDKLRFDFNHHDSLTQEQLNELELVINRLIIANLPLTTDVLPYQKALDEGAIGLFGEKYEEDVRVVTIQNDNKDWAWSKELCGGTHVKRTGDIGLFKISCESAIAAGIRRIEASAGIAALKMAQECNIAINSIADKFKVGRSNTKDILTKIDELFESKKTLEKDLLNLYISNAQVNADMLITIKSQNYGAELFFKLFNNYDIKALKRAAELGAKSYTGGIIVYCNKQKEKLNIIVAAGANINSAISAVNIAKKLASLLNSSSFGGNDLFAQLGANYSKEYGNVSDLLIEFLCANT